jgi:hypothetical protein
MNMSSTSNLCLQRWLEWTVERRRGQVDFIRIQRLLQLGPATCSTPVGKVTSALRLPLTL